MVLATDTVRVLVVDDSAGDIAIVRRLLERYDGAQFRVSSAPSARRCLETLRREGADVILLDYAMPGEDGLAFLRRLETTGARPPVIMLTGNGDEHVAVESIKSGAYDYLSKEDLSAAKLGEALSGALAEFRREEELRHYDEQIMIALAGAAEAKDQMTGGHLHRIAKYAVVLGRALGLEERDLEVLRYGALLHDIGKLAVSTAVLRKRGPLTEDEQDEIRQHPVVGERICRCLGRGREIAPILRHHHERWDGRGYVDGLSGQEIPLLARVVSAADALDAMSHDRPYRRALPLKRVLEELSSGAGLQWDPDIVGTLIDLIETKQIDWTREGVRARAT
jgi:putative two-component system response regulator